MTKKSTQLFWHWVSDRRQFSGSISVQVLSPISTVLLNEQARVRLRGFASAFDRLAKSPALNFNAKTSNCISEVSCSLLFKFVTNLFKPWEILTHEWELSLFTDIILISTPYLPCRQKVVTFNTGPILVFPRIQPFGSDDFSSLGKVYSRQATDSVNCECSSVFFVMKYCPTSTVVKNPASVKNLFTRFCCDNLSTRSWYFYNRSSCARSSVESVGVFINDLVGTNNGSHGPTITVSPFLCERWRSSGCPLSSAAEQRRFAMTIV